MISSTEADALSSGQEGVAAFGGRTHRDELRSGPLPTAVYYVKASKYNAEDLAEDENTIPPHQKHVKRNSQQQVLKLLQTINLSERESHDPPALVSHFLKLGQTPCSSRENVHTFSTDEETSSTVSSVHEYLQKAKDAPRSETLRPTPPGRKSEQERRLGYYARRKHCAQEPPPFSSCRTSNDRYNTVRRPQLIPRNKNYYNVQDTSVPSVKNVSRSKHTSTSGQDHIYERLYNRSQQKQAEGKERREAIAQASFERNWIPSPEDFGTIPNSRAEDMYHKGVSYLRKKRLGLHDKKQESDKMNESNTRKLYDKIPKSRAEDMYYKGMLYLRNKRTNLHKKQGSDHNATPPTPAPSRKIPVSKATDLYDRGIDFLQERERKFRDKRRQSDRDQVSTANTKLLKKKNKSRITKRTMMRNSESCTMERKKHYPPTSSTMPISQATNLYDKGIRYLRVKESRLHNRRAEFIKRKKQGPIPLVVHIHSECPPSRQIVQKYAHAQHLYHRN